MPPPLTSYCLRALKSRTGVTTKLRVRLLGANGISTAEKELTISESWQSLRQICHNQSIDLSTVSAMQVLNTTDGYVFYHNGFAPDAVYTAGTYPVLAGMDTDAEAPLQDLLLAGEVMGEVSYTRPMGTYHGRPAIQARCFEAQLTTNLAPQAATVLTDSSSRALVVPGRVNEFLFDSGFSDSGPLDYQIEFRVRRLDLPTPAHPDQWTAWVVAHRQAASDDADIRSARYEAGVSGLQTLDIQLRNMSSTASILADRELTITVWHWVYSA